MRRRTRIFVFFTREDVDADEVYFGVAVFAGFAGGCMRDFARAGFENDIAVFT